MGELFAYEGKVSTFISKCTDLLMINTLWLICCLPIITIGPATTAMYYTVQKSFLHPRGYVTKEFFRSFRENCKQGIGIWIIYLIIGSVFVQDIYYFYNRFVEGKNIGLLWIAFTLFMIILVLTIFYTFAYLARFKSSTKQTIKDAFLMMMLHPKTNMKLLLLMVAVSMVIYLEPLFLLILPVVLIVVVCLYLERIFVKYMDAEDIQREAYLNQEGCKQGLKED